MGTLEVKVKKTQVYEEDDLAVPWICEEQKKYVKDPVEIHNIKQRDGETIRGVYGMIQGGNRTHEESLRVHADLRIHAWG
ncbi:hypothetical protein Tco_0933042 [Tanacetum coccineum]